MATEIGPRFKLGQTVMTRGVQFMAARGEVNPAQLIRRHLGGDWGDLGAGDKQMNEDAIASGEDRILSAYHVNGEKFYVITEHDRSYTTVLLASEY